MENCRGGEQAAAGIGGREAIAAVAALLRFDRILPLTAPDEAPAAAGAYVLALCLDEPVDVRIARRQASFAPGTYVYAGSAYGPGGLRARLSRHFRRDKKLHWHVDRLTVVAARIEAIAIEQASECAIIERLGASAAFAPVLSGFGSSDCRTCQTHLLRWLGQTSRAGAVSADQASRGSSCASD